MIIPTRRELIGIATTALVLPTRGWAADPAAFPKTPVISPFTRERADIRDARFGAGLSPDGRARLPLETRRRRVWLDTQATTQRGDGASAAAPFRSEIDAYAALRGGDQLMIAGGSMLTIPIGRLPPLSGRGADYPTVIQSYDRAAPADEARYGLLANHVIYSGDKPFMSSAGRDPARFIAIRGLTFDHSTGEAGGRYPMTGGVEGLLIEQCAFLAAQLNLNSARGTFHVIRQSAFQGQWSRQSHAQGIYTHGNYDMVIEDCIFHHCGWRMSVDRTAPAAMGGPTIFNHGIYAAVQSGGILRRCVFAETSSHGAQLRGNWHSHDNVFVACPLALLHGGGTNYGIDAPNGVMALAYRNVITIAAAIRPTLPRGIGIGIENTRAGSVVEQNLVVGPGPERAGPAMSASAHAGPNFEPNPTRILFQRNTNAWSPAGFTRGAADDQANRLFVTARDNIMPADKIAFADPKRDGISAARALGFASVGALGNGMVANPAAPWAQRIADHIRPGYAPRGPRRAGGAVNPDGTWNAD